MLIFLDTLLLLLLLWLELDKSELWIKLSSGILLLTMPFNKMFNDNVPITLWLCLLTVLWILFQKKRKILWIFLLLVILIFVEFDVNSLTGNGINWDFERTIISDGKFLSVVQRFEKQALYISYSIRSWVFGNWLLIWDMISRTLNGIWLDKMMVVFGLQGIFFILAGVIYKFDRYIVITLFTGIFCGMLSRNPNYSAMWYLLLPGLISLFAMGVKQVRLWVNIK